MLKEKNVATRYADQPQLLPQQKSIQQNNIRKQQRNNSNYNRYHIALTSSCDMPVEAEVCQCLRF